MNELRLKFYADLSKTYILLHSSHQLYTDQLKKHQKIRHILKLNKINRTIAWSSSHPNHLFNKSSSKRIQNRPNKSPMTINLSSVPAGKPASLEILCPYTALAQRRVAAASWQPRAGAHVDVIHPRARASVFNIYALHSIYAPVRLLSATRAWKMAPRRASGIILLGLAAALGLVCKVDLGSVLMLDE